MRKGFYVVDLKIDTLGIGRVLTQVLTLAADSTPRRVNCVLPLTFTVKRLYIWDGVGGEWDVSRRDLRNIVADANKYARKAS